MKDDFKNLIELLEKVSKIEDSDKIQSAETEIKILASKILNTVDNLTENELRLDSKDLENLKDLINKISNKHEDQRSFLADFQNFLKSRKIN